MLPTNKALQARAVSSSHHQWWLAFTSSLLRLSLISSAKHAQNGTVLMIHTFSSGLGRLFGKIAKQI